MALWFHGMSFLMKKFDNVKIKNYLCMIKNKNYGQFKQKLS